MTFVVSLVFEDPTPRAIVNLRIVQALTKLSEATTIDSDTRQRLIRLLILLGKKLVATWRHLEKYQAHERELVRRVQAQAAPPHGRPFPIDTGQDLFIEFDEFLVQLKSALDYLVKVPIVILGRKTWSLATFGDHGEKVANALDRNLPRDLQPFAQGIKTQVLEKHHEWLSWAISLRDSLNHLIESDFAFEAFAVGWEEKEGVWRIHVPEVAEGVSASQALNDLWNNLLVLVEEFVVGFLAMRIKPGLVYFHGPAVPDSPESPWKLATVEEMKRMVQQPGEER